MVNGCFNYPLTSEGCLYRYGGSLRKKNISKCIYTMVLVEGCHTATLPHRGRLAVFDLAQLDIGAHRPFGLRSCAHGLQILCALERGVIVGLSARCGWVVGQVYEHRS